MKRKELKETTVSLTLPAWVSERDIYIIAGIELAAFKLAGEEKFHVKSSRCNECGECCENLPEKATHYFPKNEDGSCSKLISDGPSKKICSIAGHRPIPCCASDPVMYGRGKDFCSIRYDGEK